MPSLLDSIGNFIASIFHAITAALSGVLSIFESIFHAILSVVGTALDAAGTTVKGLANTFEGLLKFLMNNILVIGGLLLAVFLFSVFQQRSGRPVTANKKTS